MQLWFQVIRAMFPMSVDIAADPNTSKAPRRLQATLVKGNYKKNAGPETQTTHLASIEVRVENFEYQIPAHQLGPVESA